MLLCLFFLTHTSHTKYKTRTDTQNVYLKVLVWLDLKVSSSSSSFSYYLFIVSLLYEYEKCVNIKLVFWSGLVSVVFSFSLHSLLNRKFFIFIFSRAIVINCPHCLSCIVLSVVCICMFKFTFDKVHRSNLVSLIRESILYTCKQNSLSCCIFVNLLTLNYVIDYCMSGLFFLIFSHSCKYHLCSATGGKIRISKEEKRKKSRGRSDDDSPDVTLVTRERKLVTTRWCWRRKLD